MSTGLLPFVLTAMTYLDPGRDHFDLAVALTDEVEAVPPLFEHDENRHRTAALVVAVAFRESTLRNDAVGDNGRSRCAMQIYDGSEELLTDAGLCIRTGLAMLRVSGRVDRLNPVAFYARGPRFTTDHAKRISRDRVALAQRTLKASEDALEGLQ